MRAITIALAPLVLLLAAGCLEQTPEASRDSARGSAPAWRTLAEGDASGHEGPARLVLRSEEEWAAFWDRHAREGSGAGPAPDADFGKEVVVAAMLGSDVPCGAIRVTNVTAAGEASRVEVTTYRPGPGVGCAAVVRQPHHVVAIAGAAERVEFEERSSGERPPTPSATPA